MKGLGHGGEEENPEVFEKDFKLKTKRVAETISPASKREITINLEKGRRAYY